MIDWVKDGGRRTNVLLEVVGSTSHLEGTQG
jgi:hypothetical protein